VTVTAISESRSAGRTGVCLFRSSAARKDPDRAALCRGKQEISLHGRTHGRRLPFVCGLGGGCHVLQQGFSDHWVVDKAVKREREGPIGDLFDWMSIAFVARRPSGVPCGLQGTRVGVTHALIGAAVDESLF